MLHRNDKAASNDSFGVQLDFGQYDGDAPEEEEPQALSWREDGEKSLSDWTIVVKVSSPVVASRFTGISDLEKYPVHKNFLGAGERPCEYFKRIFRGGAASMREGASQTSELELDVSAAAAFPVFLDFVYSGKLDAATELATALFHLARYLRCHTLHKAMEAFMRKDLTPKTAPIYLSEATSYSLEALASTAHGMCVENLYKVPEEKLYALPPPLFASVMLAPEKKCADGLPPSVLLTRYCDGPHSKLIDGPFITSLADPVAMPEVSSRVSFRLLELGFQHVPENALLRERCIEACRQGWHDELLQRAEASTETAPPETEGQQDSMETIQPTFLIGSTVPAEWQTLIFGKALLAANQANRQNLKLLQEERELRISNETKLKRELEELKKKYAKCPLHTSVLQGQCCLARMNSGR